MPNPKKVKDLIAELQGFDPEAEVFLGICGEDLNDAEFVGANFAEIVEVEDGLVQVTGWM
jgi:hypothetical protein